MFKKERDLFKWNGLLKPVCEKLTNHKHNKLVMWSEPFSKGGYKYANRWDFWYKCEICGYLFFNHSPSKEDIEYIKEFDRNELERKNSKKKNT